MDFEKVCRCCLTEKREIKNIHSHMEVDGKQEMISAIFSQCLNEKMAEDDGFPQNICIFCVTTLQMSFIFKKIINKSRNTLLQYLNNSSRDQNNLGVDFCITNKREDIRSDCEQLNYIPTNKELTLDKRSVRKTHIYSSPDKKKKCFKEVNEYYYCTVCRNKFIDPIKLYEHCHSQHTQSVTSGRPCDYCNERFQDFKTLLVHRRKHLSPYICSTCFKGFLRSEDLERHVVSCKSKTNQLTAEAMPKRVMCHVCGKPYPMTYIKIHTLIHSQGNIQCKLCGKVFKQPCSLSSHILWNHKRERVHRCEYCELKFITSSSKARHVRKIHKREKKFSCNSCGKTFFCSSELKKHMVTHTGVRKYACDHCDKAYQTRHGLNVHLRSHNIQ